jgi:hypothetical protein
LGLRASQKLLTLQGAMPKETGFKQTLCAEMRGRCLHASVRCGATIAKRWNSFVSTSPARGRPTSGRNAEPQGKWRRI